MTKREFFNVLRLIRNKFNWKIDKCKVLGFHTIRGFDKKTKKEYCPITAVHKFLNNENAGLVKASIIGVDKLKLRRKTTDNIIWAADGCNLNEKTKTHYRKELLKALGVEDK